MDIKVVDCEDVDWIHLDQGTVQWQVVVNMTKKLRVP